VPPSCSSSLYRAEKGLASGEGVRRLEEEAVNGRGRIILGRQTVAQQGPPVRSPPPAAAPLPAAETLHLHGGTGAGQPAEDALPPVTSLGSDVAKAVLDPAVRPRGQTLRAALAERRRQRVALRAAARHRPRSAPVAVAADLAAQRAFLGEHIHSKNRYESRELGAGPQRA
jgi:hypothetical protein